MAKQYARGMHAWGICGRSGRKMLLRDMVFDGRYPNMRVDPAWYEARHPQETLPRVEDPIALYRPSPEVVAPPSAPVLSLVVAGDSGSISVTWTPAETDITNIQEYEVSRSVDGAAYAPLVTCVLVKDFLGGIIGITNATFPVSPEHPNDPWTNVPPDQPATYVDTAVSGGHTYCYMVEAIPQGNNQYVAQGPPITSAPVCATISAGNVLNLLVLQDYFDTVQLTDLMTGPEQAQYAAGFYTTVNLAGAAAPPRGYWVVTGAGGQFTQPGDDGLVIDGPAGHAIAVNIDSSLVRFYGGGGCAGNESSFIPGHGGSAITLSGTTVNLSISLVSGAETGRLMGGGGGGSGGATGGGGGAGGWFPGSGLDSGQAGGIYDLNHGGTGSPDVAGGAGGGSGNGPPPGGNGGGLGLAGGAAHLAGGAGGLAVNRAGVAGTTSITTGNTTANVRGSVT